ncbi:MAG TPA: hypothetical protein VK507_01535, partial [Iamia sp.]|nr:hypothetical protein [Iamia sp.]
MTVARSRPGPARGLRRARSRHLGAAVALVGLVAVGLVPATPPVAATVAPAGAPATGAPLPTG